MAVHLMKGRNAVCGIRSWHVWTTDPTSVTCPACRAASARRAPDGAADAAPDADRPAAAAAKDR